MRRARAISRRMRRPPMSPEIRGLVFHRARYERHTAGAFCDRCGDPIGEDRWECHHRKLRSRGGEDTLANLVALCPPCHHAVHAAPTQATTDGWQVPSWSDPADVPVRLHGDRFHRPAGRYWLPALNPEEETR